MLKIFKKKLNEQKLEDDELLYFQERLRQAFLDLQKVENELNVLRAKDPVRRFD